MNDNDELDPDEMIRRMIADMEEDLVEIEMRGSDYDARMASVAVRCSAETCRHGYGRQDR